MFVPFELWQVSKQFSIEIWHMNHIWGNAKLASWRNTPALPVAKANFRQVSSIKFSGESCQDGILVASQSGGLALRLKFDSGFHQMYAASPNREMHCTVRAFVCSCMLCHDNMRRHSATWPPFWRKRKFRFTCKKIYTPFQGKIDCGAFSKPDFIQNYFLWRRMFCFFW